MSIVRVLCFLTVAAGLVGAAQAESPREAVKERIKERLSERAAPRQAPDETKTLDGRTVAIWKTSFSGKAPLILFSHGFGGCETQSSNLMKALAEAGYYVVGVRHQDARCGGQGAPGAPEEKFGDPANWTSATYKDRRDDMHAVLAALKGDAALKSSVNFDKLGLIGHSLGGYTVLGLAGGWPDWTMEGVKATVALSPYCAPFAKAAALGAVKSVQFQGGTRDLGITPSVKAPGGCYDQTSKPAMFIEFEGAGHFAWTDMNASHQKAIGTYAQSFLDSKLIGGTAFNKKLPGVSELRAK